MRILSVDGRVITYAAPHTVFTAQQALTYATQRFREVLEEVSDGGLVYPDCLTVADAEAEKTLGSFGVTPNDFR